MSASNDKNGKAATSTALPEENNNMNTNNTGGRLRDRAYSDAHYLFTNTAITNTTHRNQEEVTFQECPEEPMKEPSSKSTSTAKQHTHQRRPRSKSEGEYLHRRSPIHKKKYPGNSGSRSNNKHSGAHSPYNNNTTHHGNYNYNPSSPGMSPKQQVGSCGKMWIRPMPIRQKQHVPSSPLQLPSFTFMPDVGVTPSSPVKEQGHQGATSDVVGDNTIAMVDIQARQVSNGSSTPPIDHPPSANTINKNTPMTPNATMDYYTPTDTQTPINLPMMYTSPNSSFESYPQHYPRHYHQYYSRHSPSSHYHPQQQQYGSQPMVPIAFGESGKPITKHGVGDFGGGGHGSPTSGVGFQELFPMHH